MSKSKIILAGGSGFLGRLLAKWFEKSDHEVVILSRRNISVESARVVLWDGQELGDWATELNSASALINLSGRSVDCRYHKRNRRLMMDSRIFSTRILGVAVQECSNPPAVWLNSSTATIYKHTYGNPNDESGETGATPEAKDAFSIEIARAWEKEFENAVTPKTRKLILRTAMVFADQPGGVYVVLRRLIKLGLGGSMGHGRQYVSWIHYVDFCRAIDWLISNPQAKGIYNLCSPNPITNKEMMSTIRQIHGIPIGLPATLWMLEVGAFFLRTETELIIKSRNVIPARLVSEGFTFKYPEIADAVNQLEE